MEQLNIFDETLFIPNKKLTSRQWRLHSLLLNAGKKLERKEILERMDNDYGYSKEITENPKRAFINLSCLRDLTDDLDAIVRDETIQHVYVGGGYASSKEEAEKYLRREKISALKILKKMSIQRMKLALDGQQRLTFAKERDHWESLLKTEEEKSEVERC